jgi:hypothetical protein
VNHLREVWAAKSNEAVETLLRGPKDRLYPPLFAKAGERFDMKPDVRRKIVEGIHSFLAVAAPDPASWARLWVIGSGISWNWNTGGDIDVQAWISPTRCPVDLATVRAALEATRGLHIRDLGIEGAMYLQVFAKAGEGTVEENLAQKPYACYDLDNGQWAYYPVPQTAEMYGHKLLMVEPEARGIAARAQMAIARYTQARDAADYWARLAEGRVEFDTKARMAYAEWKMAERDRLDTYDAVVVPRQHAYRGFGRGLDDPRDTIVKLLEMWGIFEDLKHLANEVKADQAAEANLQTQATMRRIGIAAGQRVWIYWNLHKNTISALDPTTGRVIKDAYFDTIHLTDVEFRVRQGGRQRVLDEQAKNVHAFVIGNYDPHLPDLPDLGEGPAGGWRRAYYNPYKVQVWTDLDDGSHPTRVAEAVVAKRFTAYRP